MKTYVINLASAPHRLLHMQRSLGKIGVVFERFDALDPIRARQHLCFSRIVPRQDRAWIPGEIGCLLSHCEVWKKIAEGPDEVCAVLEDDLIIDARLKSVLENICHLPSDADIVKLETGNYFPVFLSRRAIRTPSGLVYRRLFSGHYGSGAYLLSRRAARRLLACTEPFDHPVDNMLFFPEHAIGRMLRAYQCVPGVAIQNVDRAIDQRISILDLGMHDQREAQRNRVKFESLKSDIPIWLRLRNRQRQLTGLRMIVPFG